MSNDELTQQQKQLEKEAQALRERDAQVAKKMMSEAGIRNIGLLKASVIDTFIKELHPSIKEEFRKELGISEATEKAFIEATKERYGIAHMAPNERIAIIDENEEKSVMLKGRLENIGTAHEEFVAEKMLILPKEGPVHNPAQYLKAVLDQPPVDLKDYIKEEDKIIRFPTSYQIHDGPPSVRDDAAGIILDVNEVHTLRSRVQEAIIKIEADAAKQKMQPLAPLALHMDHGLPVNLKDGKISLV